MTSTGQDAETVPQIVAQLRQDPILVQQVLGNGHTSEIADRLTGLADDVGQPVFVALVQAPAGLANDDPTDDLLRQIHQALGEPGIYVVATPQGIESIETYGVPLKGVDLSLAYYDATGQASTQLGSSGRLSSAGEAALTLKLAADPDLSLTDKQVEQVTGDTTWLAATESGPFERDHVGEPLTPVVVAVAAGLVGAALAWRLLRAWAAPAVLPRPRGKKPDGTRAPAPPTLDALRAEAKARIERLDRALAEVPADLATLDEAEGSRDVAVDLVGSDDRLDVIGAQVLAIIGYGATEGDHAAYRPCFFNPLHGEGLQRVPSGPGGPSVPACARCESAVKHDREPDALMVVRRGRDRPYYEGSTVWARTGFGSIVDDLWLEVRKVDRR